MYVSLSPTLPVRGGKRKIETKYRLPLLNWSSIPATQISGTVFTEMDDEKIIKLIDFTGEEWSCD